jgi:DNA-binding phage protein
MSKAAVCRNFGVKRTTLLETLARLGAPHLTATSDVAA